MRKALQRRKSAQPSGQRDRILKVAASLFAQRGYHDVGVAELAKSVKLGRGALYYHIKNKEDVLFSISRTYILQLCEEGDRILSTTSDPSERVVLLSRHLIITIMNNLSEMTVCFREIHALSGKRQKEVTSLHLRYNRIWMKTFEDGVQCGKFRRIPVVGVKGLLGMYFYSFLWLDPNGPMSADKIADVFADIVLRVFLIENLD